jgi:uncharacterized protein
LPFPSRSVVECGMTKAEIIARLQQLAPALRKLGVKSATLFGSRARGDGTDASDIDLAVTPLPGVRLGPQQTLSVYGALGDAFGYDIAIDVVIMPSQNAEVNAAVERDGALAFS